MTVRPPVCAGEAHRWEVTRSSGQNGLTTLAEFVGDAAYAYKRVASPTATEWQEALTHAFEAGQDYEIRRQMELEAAAGPDQDPAVIPENLCPGCHKPEEGECECGEEARKYRAELRKRFAADGDGADPPRRKVNAVTYYPARTTTAPVTGTTATAAEETTGTTAPQNGQGTLPGAAPWTGASM
jgi:hypothetical protein